MANATGEGSTSRSGMEPVRMPAPAIGALVRPSAFEIPYCVEDERLRDFLVPVRGYDKGCSQENVEFAGIAA
jgi:hypothetical protein